MSAQSASNAASPQIAAPLAHVCIPGSPRTYEVRDALRGMELRSAPLSHAWHGTSPVDEGTRLGRQFDLKPQIVPTIEVFASEGGSPPPETALQPPVGPRPPMLPRTPRDGSRPRAEVRLAFPGAGEDPDEVEIGARRFSLLEVTSGLPDDSREEDDRREEHYLREVRAQVKLARAVASTMPGLAAILQERPDRAARFYDRFGIAEAMPRYGITEVSPEAGTFSGASG